MLLSFFVRKSPEHVFHYLSDADRFVSVHPVISKAEKRGEKFVMHETLKIAGLPVTFRYPASITADPVTRQVRMNATVSGLVHISICFDMLAEGQGTRVHETVTFRSILPVHFVMRNIFRKQHRLLFEKIGSA